MSMGGLGQQLQSKAKQAILADVAKMAYERQTGDKESDLDWKSLELTPEAVVQQFVKPEKRIGSHSKTSIVLDSDDDDDDDDDEKDRNESKGFDDETDLTEAFEESAHKFRVKTERNLKMNGFTDMKQIKKIANHKWLEVQARKRTILMKKPVNNWPPALLSKFLGRFGIDVEENHAATAFVQFIVEES